MRHTSKILRKRRECWLRNISLKSLDEVKSNWFKKLIKRMSFVNHKTFHGDLFVQRNSPCYCGSNLKFKRCCWSKHSVFHGITPAQLKEIKKHNSYYQRHRRMPNEVC